MSKENQSRIIPENQIQVRNENPIQNIDENRALNKRSDHGISITTQNGSIDFSEDTASEVCRTIVNLGISLISAGSKVIVKQLEKQQEKQFNVLNAIIADKETTDDERKSVLDNVRQLIRQINDMSVMYGYDKQFLKIENKFLEKQIKGLLKTYKYQLKLRYRAMK